MVGACRCALIVLVWLYVAALGVCTVASSRLFAQPRDPLACAFLAPLGWPWNTAVDPAPERAWPWLAATAPLANLALLALLCRALRARRERKRG